MVYRTDDLLQSIVVKRTLADVEEEDVDEPKVKKMKSMADDGGYIFLPIYYLEKTTDLPQVTDKFYHIRNIK